MPVTDPVAENSREIVQPEYLQLLLGCLILAFLWCVPIIAYTNHLKQAAVVLASVPYSQASAIETITRLGIAGAGPIEGVTSTQVQNGGILINETQNRSARAAPNHKSTLDHSSDDELASEEIGRSKRILHKQISTAMAPGRSASPIPSRTWSPYNFPSHVKAALIAIWHRN
jgi:hypothetical protein